MSGRKRVVCYGDSNTWGADPVSRGRFDADTRWTGVLAATLGAGYQVIEEGLNGRTTLMDDPIWPHRSGLAYLPPCLESHAPFDLLTIMLGTNDLKARFGKSASDIAEGATRLAEEALLIPASRDGGPVKVVLIAPPPVTTLSDLDQMFAGSVEKSRQFARYYRFFAEENPNLTFFDAGSVIRSSEVDGIHFEAGEHRKLGEALAPVIRSVLEDEG